MNQLNAVDKIFRAAIPPGLLVLLIHHKLGRVITFAQQYGRSS